MSQHELSVWIYDILFSCCMILRFGMVLYR